MKTIAEQLADSQAALTSEQNAHATTKAALETANTNLSAASAEITQLKADLSAAQAANATLKNENTALSNRATSAEASLETAKRTLIKAEKTLALDPDYINLTGRPAPVADGSTGASGGEPQMTAADYQKHYETLTDPKARAEYRKAHWKALGLKQEPK